MKKLLSSLLILLFVALPLAACAGQTGNTPPAVLRIGVSVYDQYDTFITLLMDRFHSYIRQQEEALGITITVMQESANNSQITQNSQVEGFLQGGCDILCVNLVDRTDASVIIDKAEAAGVPVLFFNRELVPEDLERSADLYYVGADALMSGQLQGQLVLDLWQSRPEEVDRNGDGQLQYVILEGEAGHQDAIYRTEYCISTLIQAGVPVEKLGGAVASWVRARAESRMGQWINQFGVGPVALNEEGEAAAKHIEVVFANNDDMALGAIDALEKANIPREDWPIVVGIDGHREGLAAVEAGTLYGTVFNNADGQAKGLVDLACWLFAGQPLPAEYTLIDGTYIRLPYEPITKENVAQYQKIYD